MTWYKFTTPWGAEVETWIREDTQDWNTMQSCIVEDEYLVSELPEACGEGLWCVDIGAHAGGFSLAALSKGYNVIIVEPIPENIDSLTKNIERNGWSDNVLIYQNAIHHTSNNSLTITYGDTSTDFGRIHRFIGNTNYGSVQNKNLTKINVQTVSIDDILKDFESIEMFKIDCEGAEWQAFSTFKTFNKVKRFVAEVHPPGTTKNLRASFGNFLDETYKDKTLFYFGDQFGPEATGLVYFVKE